MSKEFVSVSWKERLNEVRHQQSIRLLEIMEEKKTNLCVSADVTTSAELLKLVEDVGPFVCMVKTHIDIVSDFTQELSHNLKVLANHHNFLLFEDRKFADLGSTVQRQFAEGVHKISSWSDIINAHVVVGPGIVKGLESVSKGQGLLLIAQMSAAGNLCTGEYTQTAVKMAEDNPDFVMGFINVSSVTPNPMFLNLVPGVHLASKGDKMGQQYVSPAIAVQKGADVIIVGRGIYAADDSAKAAQLYRDEGYKAYLESLQ